VNEVSLSTKVVATNTQWKSWYAAGIIYFKKISKEIVPFQQEYPT